MTDARPTDAEVEVARWWVEGRDESASLSMCGVLWLMRWSASAGREGAPPDPYIDARARAILAAAGEANDDE